MFAIGMLCPKGLQTQYVESQLLIILQPFMFYTKVIIRCICVRRHTWHQVTLHQMVMQNSRCGFPFLAVSWCPYDDIYLTDVIPQLGVCFISFDMPSDSSSFPFSSKYTTIFLDVDILALDRGFAPRWNLKKVQAAWQRFQLPMKVI